MNTRLYRLLTQLLSRPTAPFREQQVLHYTPSVLHRARIPHFSDPAGNLVIGCVSPAAYRALLRRPSKEPVRLFIAHGAARSAPMCCIPTRWSRITAPIMRQATPRPCWMVT